MNHSINHSHWSLVFTVLFTAAALVGCPPPGDNGTDNGDPPDNRVTVPGVVDMTQSDAQGSLVLAGLIVGNVTSIYSDEVPEGYVISQNPAAGNTVNQGSAVSLVVSLGSDTTAGEETFILPGNVPLRMVWIEPGTFMMGRNQDEQDSLHLEDPQHEVTIANDFWMGKYTVTKRQWQAVMGSTPWAGRTRVLDHLDSPAVYISWNDAHNFITALNAHIVNTGQGPGDFRLPSEAEWEYACRAGSTTRFYWGDDPEYTQISHYAWWQGNAWDAGNRYAHVVGAKLPNAWGLYDMSGNVGEWCADDWHSSYVGAPGNGSAWVDSPRASYRVTRGGSWRISGYDCRSAFRGRTGADPSDTHNTLGFRLAR